MSAHRPRPAVLLVFEPDGRVTACPVVDVAEDARELAARLQRFARDLIENPSLIGRAAGIAA